jgi:hypothetical protein
MTTHGSRLSRAAVWLLVSVLAVLAQLLWTPSSLVDGSYRPIGNDSFYHAQRIRSTALDPSAFYEFDPKIDAPQGTLLIWPWGYDRTAAAIVRLAMRAGIASEPMHAIVLLPVAAVVISVGLVVAIATLLGLSLASTAIAALCVALSPLTQLMHSIGMVDHHYAEYIFILASLASGLWWMRSPGSVARGCLAGAVLGMAPACHSALFLLQIPLLATLAMLWIRATSLPLRPTVAFAISLVAATLLVLLPSEPFQRGHFEFYRLSWFQLYIAASTAILAMLLSRLPRSPKGSAALAAAALLLLAPLLGQIGLADRFLARDFGALASIHEAQSFLSMLSEPSGPLTVSRLYSLLVWFAPLLMLGSAWALWKRPEPYLTLYYVAAIAGLAMLLAMFRFHNYGSFALYLTPLLWLENVSAKRGLPETRTALAAGLLLLVAFAPGIRYLFASNPGPGGEPYYAVTRAIYPILADACRKNPGIVLASNNDGHYIRFHTDCAVIATNFLVTKQDEEALTETQRLLSLTPAELLASGVPVRYILARGQGMLVSGPGGALTFADRDAVAGFSPTLVSDLLFGNAQLLGSRYRLVAELRLDGAEGYPYARLFEILPRAGQP